MSLKLTSGVSFPEDTPTPPRRNDPGGIVTFLLGVGCLLATLLVPSVNGPLREMLSRPVHPSLDPSMIVWASKDAGVYYCPDTKLYRRGVGAYMKQGDALTRGYQPASGDYCNPKNKDVAKNSAVARREGSQGNRTSTADGSDPLVSGQSR